MQKALRSTMRKYFVISKESAPAIGSDLNIFCCNQLEVVFAYQHIDCFSTRKKMIKQVTTKSTTYFDHSICRIPSLRGKSLLVRRYRYVIFFISTHFFKCRCVELHTYVYFKILFFLGRYLSNHISKRDITMRQLKQKQKQIKACFKVRKKIFCSTLLILK